MTMFGHDLGMRGGMVQPGRREGVPRVVVPRVV